MLLLADDEVVVRVFRGCLLFEWVLEAQYVFEHGCVHLDHVSQLVVQVHRLPVLRADCLQLLVVSQDLAEHGLDQLHFLLEAAHQVHLSDEVEGQCVDCDDELRRGDQFGEHGLAEAVLQMVVLLKRPQHHFEERRRVHSHPTLAALVCDFPQDYLEQLAKQSLRFNFIVELCLSFFFEKQTGPQHKSDNQKFRISFLLANRFFNHIVQPVLVGFKRGV